MNNPTSVPDKRELRRFGFITGALVAALFGMFFPWLFSSPVPLWPWLVACLLAVWALLLPATLGPLYRGWLIAGEGLGWINSRIILGILFYVMILPIGLLMRLFGNDPMRRHFDKNVATYRIPTKHRSKDHMEKPF